MKKYLAASSLLLAFALAAPPTFAQTSADAASGKASHSHKKSSGRADAELADLSTQLNLTQDQKDKIRPILEDKTEKIHAAKESSTGSNDDEKAKTKAIREAANAQIRAILTPDQQKIFDKTSKKRGKKAAPAV